MNTIGCVAMVLAGGRGKRLGALTRYYSKPAIHVGSKYRMIDFTLNNCKNSGIQTIGILSQHFCSDLHVYIASVYHSKPENDNIYMLPPQNNHCYEGTADAVYKNIAFIEKFRPANVLILAGDHVYKMDYGKMIDFHRQTGADITVASTPVPVKEASRFGIINANKSGHVYCFEEKPIYPKSRLASMGIYVFKWDALKKYLLADRVKKGSHHDFGRDILPRMLHMDASMYTYVFDRYWRDVGTVDNLLEANLDLIHDPDLLYERDSAQGNRWKSSGPNAGDRSRIPYEAEVRQSIVAERCSVLGRIENSVISDRVIVGKGAEIVDSCIMPGAYIGNNVQIYRAVVGTGAILMDDVAIGVQDGSNFYINRKVCAQGVSLVAPWLYIKKDARFRAGSHITGTMTSQDRERESEPLKHQTKTAMEFGAI